MTAQIAALPTGLSFPCEIHSSEGNRLKISCSTALALRTAVKVENSASLWLGEVWVCEPEAAGYHLEIEVTQVLRDPRSVERMAGRFRQTPKAEHLA